MAMESGMLLKGRYKTEKKLGENAVGETYVAIDSQTDTKVVVKQIKDEYVARTYEAIKACGKLDGIVGILDVFDEDGNFYAVMEFVSGMTLENYLAKSNAKFPVNRIKTLLKPVVGSLIRLSEDGISHGNISADNFVFTNQGDLKLIGFGHISGVVSKKSRPYTALEMYEKDSKPSEASDIYSISAFIYRCITGIVPPEATDRNENDTCVRPLALGVEMGKDEDSALWMGMNVDNGKRLLKLSAFYRAFFSTNQSVNLSNQKPIKTQINPNGTGKKKKKGNTILIVLIIVGIIIVLVLGFFTYRLATDYDVNSDSDRMSGVNSESESETDSDLDKVEELMDSGQYEDAISALVDYEIDEDDGADILKEAIDNLYSQCVNEANALIDGGNFDTAYETIDNRTQYFADIRTKLDYVDNTYDQELSDLRDSIEPKLVEYYSGVATNAANADDEEKMVDAFNQLEGRMDDVELSNKKESDYTKLVLVHMVSMSSSGSSAKDIRDYLDSMLSDTGNNCRVMEFWDYYDNLYYSTLKENRMTASPVSTYNGYVIPYSDLQELNYSDINNLSEYELYFALYEIYARHGRMFTDTAVSEHFNNTSWYNPSISPEVFDETTLSDIEKKNVATILQFCRDMGYRS
jgi:serine/threonine protein kinase